MTLRHPERLGPEGEYDNDPPATAVPAVYGMQNLADDVSSAGSENAASSPRKPACDRPPVVHPFTTDFGPKTLTEYLRSECDRLEPPSVVGKGKDKEVTTTNSDLSYCGHPSSETHRNPDTDVEHAVGDDAGSDRNIMIFGSSLDTPAAIGVYGGLSAIPAQYAGQSLTDEASNLPPTGLLEITNSQPALIESQSLLSTTSGMGTRRSQRLARKELGTRDVCRVESTPRVVSQPPQQTGATKPSRGRSQPAVALPDAESKLRRSRAQSASHSSQPTNHTSQTSSSSLSRRTNFEEHTKTKRQVVRAMTARTPRTLEESTGQAHKKARQVTGLKQPGVSSSLVKDSTGDSTLAGAGSSENSKSRPHRLHNPCPKLWDEPRSEETSLLAFDYAAVVPECIPDSEKQKLMDAAQHPRLCSTTESDSELERIVDVTVPDSRGRREPNGTGISNTSCNSTHISYPRVWSASKPHDIQPSDSRGDSGPASRIPPGAETPTPSPTTLEDLDAYIWMDIATYLSTKDLKRLRLVSHTLAGVLDKLLFRNVVVNFGQSFFDVTGGSCDGEAGWSPTKSMFQDYGSNINQFGVAFELDMTGLSYAKPKVIEKEQTAWFGTFTWPTEQYPRFPALQAVEDLVDHNRPLLKEAFKHITKASELGLCIDSGHGWLEGPDISDLALFNQRLDSGSRVFGKTFKTEDTWTTFARDEYFRWAQQNTINETTKHVLEHRIPEHASPVREMRFLNSVQIRDIESFKSQEQQPDYDPNCHVGGSAGTNAQDFPNVPLAMMGGWIQVNTPAARRLRRTVARRQNPPRRQPQWPLIFGGHNIAAEVGGHCTFVQAKTAHPTNSPLLPGHLTEAQAQWLMETVWAQRAFLSAYTTAIITNKQNFQRIHTVRISKLSSGLLPSLEQGEFWSSLPGLKTLQILISPDWRQEHCIGDRFHYDNMPISPAKAAQMFTRFLRKYVVKREHLQSLTVGYVGGGEHAVGMFARNQHVLPAPIIDDPRAWLHEKMDGREVSDMTKFDHIRDLKFENCWFSRWMLQEFMNKSRDTSLHSLVLDSVSMTPCHDPTIDHALTTAGDNLRCQYDVWNWYRETLPSSAAWCRVLDRITPGTTLGERKHEAGQHRKSPQPPPKRSFRGHNQKIVFNSCGYVKISLPKKLSRAYKQNAAVTHFYSPMDGGVRARKERYNAQVNPAGSDPQAPVAGFRGRHQRGSNNENDSSNRVMMSTHSPGSEEYPWLGTLTQCVHPIEKRVLEEGWGMKFGWPDNLDRWAAVEDGFYEGGTGRFSGVVEKDYPSTDEETS